MEQKKGEKNIDVKRIQALKWMAQRVNGQSSNEIAAENNISHDVVDQRLSWAKKAGLFTSYEDKLLQELVPAAHKALLSALEDGDAAVALEIFKGTQLLKGPKQSSNKINVTQHGEVDESGTLQLYMKKLRDAAQEKENVIEGQVEGQTKLLGTGEGPASD